MTTNYDYLPGTDFKMIQPENMYHYSSDVQLLGTFMEIKRKDHVLDIGCGTGALMLYASLGNPEKLCGIDLFDEVISAAKKNMIENKIQAQFFTGKVQNLKNELFDVLICNPPYFSTKNQNLINENKYIAAARHDSFLTTSDLFLAANHLLKSNGRFYLVQRPENINVILKNAYENNFGLIRSQFAYDKNTSKCRIALLEFRFGEKRETVIEPPVYI